MRIKFLTADNLPKMDMGSDATMDIYFETTYMGKSIKTDYVTASKASAIID